MVGLFWFWCFLLFKKKKNWRFLCKIPNTYEVWIIMSLSCLILVQPFIRAPCSDSLWDIIGEFDPHWVPVYCSLFVRLTFICTQQMHSLNQWEHPKIQPNYFVKFWNSFLYSAHSSDKCLQLCCFWQNLLCFSTFLKCVCCGMKAFMAGQFFQSHLMISLQTTE